jgi:predicted nucleic-acid-binding Zn-ribbon protein
MQRITSCPKCGGNRFFLNESTTWSAHFDDIGVLHADIADNETTDITCVQCNEDIQPAFLENEQEIEWK